jgi:hypothetical protein
MADTRAEHHMRRYEALEQQRFLRDQDAQDIVELICPFADDVTTRRSDGDSRTEALFDTTAVLANNELASSLLGDMSSPAIEWYKFGFRQPELNELGEVRRWAEVAGQIQLAGYVASNFYSCIHEYHAFRSSFGTAAMYVGATRSAIDARLMNLRFKNLPYGSYCIVENEQGVVDTLYRTIALTPRQAVQRWRDVPKLIRQKLSNEQEIDRPMSFVQCVYPRDDSGVYARQGRVDNKAMPWADVTILRETKEIVEESGFHEFPFVVSRWEQMGSSPWGYGPGHLALPEVRILNKLRELHLQQLALWVQPPLQAVKEGVIGNISLESLAVNYVSQPGAIQPLQFTGRPDLVQLSQSELQNSIRNIFYGDVLAAIPPADASQMTAYEVAQRIELRTRRIGPAFHRLTSEMFDRLADRVFGLLWRAGQIPPPPREVLLAAAQNYGRIDVEYTGPLARAQRGGDVRALNDMAVFTGQLAQLSGQQDLWDTLILDDTVRHVAQINNVPEKLMRDVLVVQQMRQARVAQQQAMMQAQETRDNMGAVAGVAPLVQAMQQRGGRAA